MRYDIIQRLIDQNDYKRYLEIGVAGGDNFTRINAPIKHGVDPSSPYANYKMTSNDFFKQCNEVYDIIFIDGLHLEEQVTTDILNSLGHLSDGGVIVVHDCLPTCEAEQVREQPHGRPWTGDVWKAFAKFRMTCTNLEMFVINADCGCGIIRHGTQELAPMVHDSELTWKFFLDNAERVLNVKSPDNWS
jgi:hypothetical protein